MKNTKNTITLEEALRGMCVKNWERRQSSNGRTVVYVRYAEKAPVVTTRVCRTDPED